MTEIRPSAEDAPPRSFAGNAEPYAGGDPYADYRTAPVPFGHLPDLADRDLGAAVVAASDEFFAERENLITPTAPRFDPRAFGHKGKVMDGWETRRRRGATAAAPHPAPGDHDWALIRLGVPGRVHGLVVDTAHFRGNHPEAVSVEAAALPGTPAPEELLAGDVKWTVLVPRTPVGGHAANAFAVGARERFTHLRLRQYPDGGVARLRVHGEAVPDPAWLAALGVFDLAALENGGHVEDASDRFYSSPFNSIRPGRSREMGDGWETRRRRDTGHDWVRYRLTGRAALRGVEIDTGCYKGNAPGWAALSILDATAGADPADPGADWTEVLPRTRLQPDAVHRFPLAARPVATHVRIDVLPDGGVARLRVHGSLTDRPGDGPRPVTGGGS
ncbi:allantoicase [Streptomyces eurocidicus]|uniref:Probable allantoicase n=1 Tax=Streptomyces eurocidicus TaxID=66423 RepID=A0A2N8NUS5_STREU|nr:allantoicase [Streptomyces eurocidicus]MBB5121254.1 allantoicase [Streptomyces eurocidicus]MBF6055863.1 allantoicase [Streptomyces eurocidicus]PNE32535.1 allantoicase [Streptomyces eurocidicus]